MADPVIYSGPQFTISFARENSGRYPGAEFFESLDRADKAKLMVLFKMLGDQGRIANPEKLGNLKNGLFESNLTTLPTPPRGAAS